jgi:hypothetical protein
VLSSFKSVTFAESVSFEVVKLEALGFQVKTILKKTPNIEMATSMLFGNHGINYRSGSQVNPTLFANSLTVTPLSEMTITTSRYELMEELTIYLASKVIPFRSCSGKSVRRLFRNKRSTRCSGSSIDSWLLRTVFSRSILLENELFDVGLSLMWVSKNDGRGLELVILFLDED